MDKYIKNIDKVKYIEDYNEIISDLGIFIKKNINRNICILVMGAGNSYKITDKIKKYLNR